ncbi:aromatic amino acid transaminase [Novosphingobium sp. BW1]|uniref:aromatic amino acid transaminase n=1 Tax=Novosphingobium sp. BW1 TaxID=2592621 RepID=UPI0011DE6931|nr:aromatic amino acid transaminase [Novosphingobium sp. BW1]TYC86303.1 aminotransferase class I/II-fold pyridoxal phosphate-dependent enzyme [Novosphingobium sp. BW1]
MLFDRFDLQPDDPLLALIGEVRADPRRHRLDLSVGVYRDEKGQTPVMRAVKAAEAQLVAGHASKAYLGPAGDADFCARIANLVLGACTSRHTAGMQSVGGTGALRLAARLLAVNPRPHGAGPATIWLATPTWGNHVPVFEGAGLRIRTFAHTDAKGGALDFSAWLEIVERAEPGDAILLQGCGHNPTGIDFTSAQWATLATRIADKGLFPLVDLAYQGFGLGLEEDATGVRALVERVPETLIAVSCNKTFGLYRDRVGALLMTGTQAAPLAKAMANAKGLARGEYSMPPDHGAAVVRTILESAELTALWTRELDAMRARLVQTRAAIAAHPLAADLGLSELADQKGMFCLLGAGLRVVQRLKDESAIYVAPDGRVNLAGLPLSRVDDFVAKLSSAYRAPQPEMAQ